MLCNGLHCVWCFLLELSYIGQDVVDQSACSPLVCFIHWSVLYHQPASWINVCFLLFFFVLKLQFWWMVVNRNVGLVFVFFLTLCITQAHYPSHYFIMYHDVGWCNSQVDMNNKVLILKTLCPKPHKTILI